MTYHAGLRGFERFGLTDTKPHIYCDRCGVTHGVKPDIPSLEFDRQPVSTGWTTDYSDIGHLRHF